MKKLTILFLSAAAFCTVLSSCKKMLDVMPGDELDQSQMYRNVYDADAAVIGIYGKFQGLAERYVLLNELRADMLNYTDHADEYLRQLSNHTVTADNPYASPRPFYEVILNCNDVLKNFDVMLKDKKMKESEYAVRYADITCLRSFLYLQLGIHYGEIPYVTGALESVEEVKDAKRFPKLSFDALLDTLIRTTEALTYKDEYPAGASPNITVDGYPTGKWFINKKVLLGDLNLWKGNYVQAATWYRQVMETAANNSNDATMLTMYKVGWDSNGDVDHYISYSRGGDATSLVWNTQWRIMYEQAANTKGYEREWVWAIPFDSRFKPENPFVKLFSPIGGQYLVKPSQEAFDNWNSQQQLPNSSAPAMPGLPYDARGILTCQNINGQPVVMKYLYNYLNWSTMLPVDVLKRTSTWFLFKQTHLHMRFAEAANRAGKHLLAWGLFNNGIAGAYPAPTSDVTNYHNTLFEPYPFNFDARNSGNSGIPYYRAPWYRNIGIRRRANLQNYAVAAGADSTLSIENGLINETALEDAYEGTRWPDLLRIALRRNDPSFLADKIYRKLKKDNVPGAEAARAKLMDKSGWYLPFKF
ncbi:RagB/SusD family protein [Chitinophaga sp. CB10]|uniref:RagB/SusD family protein n=1 Tax=Chitinophaga sp. CB10 TaxID=1891659 RepID=UPI0025BE1965|nr:RagB/SusD family protein [Chitinophaga sp. CB10]